MGLLEALAGAVTAFISQTSYPGVSVLMALESANIPIPSEVILPFSGFLVSRGVFEFWIVVAAGTVGCTVGSLGSYYLGRWSDKSWVRDWTQGWGRVLITPEELAVGESWLARHGEIVVFISRLLPIVRTFISFPAGMSRVNLTKFTVYTAVGSLIWSTLLTYIGFVLGENWRSLEPIFRQFDLVILSLGIISLAWLVAKRGKRLVNKG